MGKEVGWARQGGIGSGVGLRRPTPDLFLESRPDPRPVDLVEHPPHGLILGIFEVDQVDRAAGPIRFPPRGSRALGAGLEQAAANGHDVETPSQGWLSLLSQAVSGATALYGEQGVVLPLPAQLLPAPGLGRGSGESASQSFSVIRGGFSVIRGSHVQMSGTS